MLKGQVEGVEDLKKALRAIGKKAAASASLVAVQYGAKDIEKIVKANALAVKDTGALYRSIRVNPYKKRRNSGAAAYVGPASNYKEGSGKALRWPAKYAHLVERGYAVKGGGTVPARSFLRVAIDTGSVGAVKTMGKTFGTSIGIQIDKLPEVKKARLKGKKKP